MKLEELARQSSTAARVSVAHLDPPPVGRRQPQRSLMPVVAGAALCALIVGGLFAVLRYSGDDTAEFSEPVPVVDEVPRLGLPTLESWTVSTAGSYADLGGDPSNQPSFTYYGDPEADDPFADGDLLIAVFAGAEPPLVTPDGEQLELRGTTATLTSGLDQGVPDDALAIQWSEAGQDGSASEIIVVSRSFGRDELTAIVEALDVDATLGTVALPGDIGLERLSGGSGTPLGAFRGSGEGYLVVYESADGNRALVISTTHGDLDREIAAMRWWTADIVSTTVNGRPAAVVAFDETMPDLGSSVIWSPADGIIANLAVLGAGDDLDGTDLVALAELAVELDDETWASYLALADQLETGANEFDEVWGEGEGAVGDTELTWVIGLQGTDVCVNIQEDNNGYGTCQPRSSIVPPAGSAATIDNTFSDVFAEVLIAADPIVEQVVETTGTWTVFRVDADGVAFFLAIGDADVQPRFEVIVDGAVVDTLEAAVSEVADETFILPDPDPEALADVRSLMSEVMSDTSDPAFQWWFGTDGDDLCLAVDGVAPSGSCSPSSDITVLPTVWSPFGEMTLVALRDVPACITSFGIDGQLVEQVAVGNDSDHRYQVVVARGLADGWTLQLEGLGALTEVELPGAGDALEWPPFLCEG